MTLWSQITPFSGLVMSVDGASGGMPAQGPPDEPVADEILAAEPGPEPATEERVPFYKREIGFRRGRQVEPGISAGDSDEADVVPFYKREISLRRRKDDEGDDLPPALSPLPFWKSEFNLFSPKSGQEEGEHEDADAPLPFYKREITLRRRNDEEEAVAAEAGTEEPPAGDDLPQALSPLPFWKREFHLFSPKSGQEEEHEDADAPVPFYKREITLRRRKDDEPALPVAEDAEQIGWPETGSEPEPEREHEPEVVAEQPEPEVVQEPAVEEVEDAAAHDELAAELVALASVDDVVRVDDAPSHVYVLPEDDPERHALAEELVALDALHDDTVLDEALAAQSADAAERGKMPFRKRFGRRNAGNAIEDGAPEAVTEAAAEVPVKAKRGVPLLALRRGGGPKGAKGRRMVGLRIGSSDLAAAVVNQVDGRHELESLVRSPLEPGVVVDGEVRDQAALAVALREFFATHRLPTRDVRIGLATNRIGVRMFDLAGIEDEARLDNAVRFKAHEVLPVTVHESVLDYRVLGERTTDGGENVRDVLLVVAPREQIEPYVAVSEQAGIRLAGIDLEALGLLRVFVEPPASALASTQDVATVVVQIGHEVSTLLVSGRGVCEFTRVFDWGRERLQEAIATELEIDLVAAEDVLSLLSLTGDRSRRPEDMDDETWSRAVAAMRGRLTPFARELVSSLQFYQSQPRSLGIGEILITGGTSHLDGLAETLGQMIGVSVRVGNPLGRVVVHHDVDPAIEAAIGAFAVPVGLAIEDDRVRFVNLLPEDARSQRRKLPVQAALLPAAAIVPIAAVGVLWFQAQGQVSDKERQVSALESQLAALPRPKTPTVDPALGQEAAARAQSVATVLSQRVAWDAALEDLARVLPKDVWLTAFTAKAPTQLAVDPATQAAAAQAGAAPKPVGVTLSGYAYTHADVASLLARLGTLPSLELVTLQQSTVTEIAKKPVVTFTIVANVRNGGGQ